MAPQPLHSQQRTGETATGLAGQPVSENGQTICARLASRCYRPGAIQLPTGQMPSAIVVYRPVYHAGFPPFAPPIPRVSHVAMVDAVGSRKVFFLICTGIFFGDSGKD